MKQLATLFFAVFACVNLSAQHPGNVVARTTLDTRFAPFYHGVASGDPMTDRVVIWTRVTPDQPGAVSVDWAMATDTGITNVVASGTVNTSDARDYTVKVDVTGLNAGTWYYYRFTVGGRHSLVGRTYTFPSGDVDSLRFGVVSCSNYPAGFFNAYGALAQRNDIHAVLHLGDYIYEGGDSSGARGHSPSHEILSLEDYRLRHSQYKLDEDLRWLHQMYPFIVVWDDHESANDSWSGGAENHTVVGEGLWGDRKRRAVQAYLEWQPIRQPNPSDTVRIYRRLDVGDLIDFYMLDTRLIARDEQTTAQLAGDPNRHLLGDAQLAWLSAEMQGSNAQWKVMGQQVMMAPLTVFGFPVNLDQWDGYAAERARVYDSILTRNIENVVVLTGDIHTAWANDLPGAGYDANTGAGSVGVEFVTTSVTSGNTGVNFGQQVIQLANPHMKYINLSEHGFLILDVNKARAQGDFYYVNDIATAGNYSTYVEDSWYVNAGTRFLVHAGGPSAASPGFNVVPPPRDPSNPALSATGPVGVGAAALLGVYPNPFETEVYANYYLHAAAEVELVLMTLEGKVVAEKAIGRQAPGLRFDGFQGLELASGVYLLRLRAGEYETVRRVVRY